MEYLIIKDIKKSNVSKMGLVRRIRSNPYLNQYKWRFLVLTKSGISDTIDSQGTGSKQIGKEGVTHGKHSSDSSARGNKGNQDSIQTETRYERQRKIHS